MFRLPFFKPILPLTLLALSGRARAGESVPGSSSAPPVAVAPTDSRPHKAPKTQGVQFDGGLAVGSVAGTAVEGATPLSRVASVMTVAVLGLGYRYNHFYLGASAVAGTGAPRSTGDFRVCDEEGVDCQTALIRYGLQARFYLFPKGPIDPWLGVGIGRELFAFNVSAPGESVTFRGRGQELVNLRLGADFLGSGPLRGNAFLDYSACEFSHVEIDDWVAVPSAQRSVHHWIMLGAGVSWLP